MTEYKSIPGMDGYLAGSDGEIYSTKQGKLKRLTASPTIDNGYLHVGLYLNDRRKTINVHRLVALAWHGERPSKNHQIRHLNGNQLDNRPCNLEYGTSEQNYRDRDIHGTTAKGERIGTSKLTEDQVREIRRLFAEGATKLGLSKQFGVSRPMIRSIVERKWWKHVA